MLSNVDVFDFRFQKRPPAASVTNTQQRKQCKVSFAVRFCCMFLQHQMQGSQQKIQKYAVCVLFTRGSLIGKLPYTNVRAPQITTATTTTTHHHHHYKAQPSQLVHSLTGNASWSSIFWGDSPRFADVRFFDWSEQCSNFGWNLELAFLEGHFEILDYFLCVLRGECNEFWEQWAGVFLAARTVFVSYWVWVFTLWCCRSVLVMLPCLLALRTSWQAQHFRNVFFFCLWNRKMTFVTLFVTFVSTWNYITKSAIKDSVKKRCVFHDVWKYWKYDVFCLIEFVRKQLWNMLKNIIRHIHHTLSY